MSKMMTIPEMHGFRAALAAKLGVADPDAPNAELFKVLDLKLNEASLPKVRSAARDWLGIWDRRLFEAAWPDQPAGHHVDLGSDDQLYAQAWGFTEREA